MGAPRSGRWGGAPTIEGCGTIVMALGRLLELGKGRSAFTVSYSGRLGGHPYSIAVAVAFGANRRGTLTITHGSFKHLSAAVLADSYVINMLAVPWQFGGQRWFIVCPRSGRRVLKLYLPNGAQRFASRQVMGLAYQVQRLDPVQKGHARLARIFAKLGVHYHTLHQAIPARPKWMRVITYCRLVKQIEEATLQHRMTYCAGLGKIMAAEDQAFAETMASGQGRQRRRC